MFKWLKELFGFEAPLEPTLQADKDTAEKAPAPVAETKPKADKPKKTTKKAAKVDLDSMKKNELLAHAKANGIKANASMNKAALIDAIKNG
jgi:hypothetical protein